MILGEEELKCPVKRCVLIRGFHCISHDSGTADMLVQFILSIERLSSFSFRDIRVLLSVMLTIGLH